MSPLPLTTFLYWPLSILQKIIDYKEYLRIVNCSSEFSLNVSLNSVTKILVITVKGLEPATQSHLV